MKIEHAPAERYSATRPNAVTAAQVTQIIESVNDRGDAEMAKQLAAALGVVATPTAQAPLPLATRAAKAVALDLLAPTAPAPKPRHPQAKPNPAAPRRIQAPAPRKARPMSETPNPTQSAVDQISGALLWLEQCQPKIAKPWEHGITSERTWRKLATEAHGVAHRLMPVIGACDKASAAHLTGAQRAAKLARRAVGGGTMPRKRRRKRA